MKSLAAAFGKPKDKASSPKIDAAQDVLDAIKDGDAESLAAAMELFMECCSGSEEEDSEEGDDDKEL